MSRIFISYARADVEFARKLARSLSEMGAEVWLDVNDIPAGMKWSSAIQQGLNVCQVMLLIISPESMASNNVEDEWQYFLDEKKPVIPLWHRPAKKHFQINRLQHVDFNAVSYHIAFDRLRRELQGRGVSVEGVKTDASRAHSRVPLPTTAPQPTVAPIKPASASIKPTSISLMPTPFAWIAIPNKGYSIGKYPVTNAQFAKFIEAGGYNQQKWWTDTGWERRQQEKWTQPRDWTHTRWNGVEQPIVGISSYEMVAFCLWLSDTTGDNILLPSEEQWQYAAQGDDARNYPWGNEWDGRRCNNNVGKNGIGKTTSVRQYQGKGDSPFGVVDMVGNVWEWCLTKCEYKANNINVFANTGVLRGGSWSNSDIDIFRCGNRDEYTPYYGFNYIGFRLILS